MKAIANKMFFEGAAIEEIMSELGISEIDVYDLLWDVFVATGVLDR
jgi:hypothetical protein